MTRQKDNVPEPLPDRRERESRQNGPAPAKIAEQAQRQMEAAGTHELTEEEERLIQEAACYCLRHFPMLWTTGGLPEERQAEDGTRQWLIRMYLRYPTGHEGYLGDLLYDGKQFTELTDRAVMRERAKQIATDPDRTRKWNE